MGKAGELVAIGDVGDVRTTARGEMGGTGASSDVPARLGRRSQTGAWIQHLRKGIGRVGARFEGVALSSAGVGRH